MHVTNAPKTNKQTYNAVEAARKCDNVKRQNLPLRTGSSFLAPMARAEQEEIKKRALTFFRFKHLSHPHSVFLRWWYWPEFVLVELSPQWPRWQASFSSFTTSLQHNSVSFQCFATWAWSWHSENNLVNWHTVVGLRRQTPLPLYGNNSKKSFFLRLPCLFSGGILAFLAIFGICICICRRRYTAVSQTVV